jgi:DUF917 family protein
MLRTPLYGHKRNVLLILIRHQISDVERKTVGGFARGTLTISPFVDDPVFKRPLIIKFQNENLIASHISHETGKNLRLFRTLLTYLFL